MILAALLLAAAATAAAATTPTSPTSPPAAEDVESIRLLAESMLAAGDADSARTIVDDAIAKHPAANGFHELAGEVWLEQGNRVEAFYEYEWEVLRSGDTPAGQHAARRASQIVGGAEPAREPSAVFDAVRETASDPAAARAALDDIAKTRGDRVALVMFRAEATEAAGDRAAAEALYRRAIVLDPELVAADVELAAALEHDGDPAHAKEAASLRAKAKSLDPGNWALQR